MLCAAVTAVTLLAAPGCTRVVTGSAVRGAGAPGAKSSQCKRVSAPLTKIRSHAAGEPRLRIPQPPGWRRAAMLDSAVIRFTMGNKALAANNFIPTAVVTLESVPGGNTDYTTIFDQERSALIDRLGATGLETVETTLCGDTAEMVSYDAPAMGRIPPRKIKTLMVANAFNANTYVATVTVQSTEPDNRAYARDTETILTGFQMLPPKAG
jgi:Probable lipoprotein LpqN